MESVLHLKIYQIYKQVNFLLLNIIKFKYHLYDIYLIDNYFIFIKIKILYLEGFFLNYVSFFFNYTINIIIIIVIIIINL